MKINFVIPCLLGLEKLIADEMKDLGAENVLAENGRANAFYRKAGFRFVKTEEKAVVIRGQEKDLNWYEIER